MPKAIRPVESKPIVAPAPKPAKAAKAPAPAKAAAKKVGHSRSGQVITQKPKATKPAPAAAEPAN